MGVDEQRPDMRRQRGTSRPCSAKSISIKNGKCRSGDCAGKAAGITPGDLFWVAATRLRPPRGGLTAGQKSAEGTVVKTAGESRKERRPERLEREVASNLMSGKRRMQHNELTFRFEGGGEDHGTDG